LGLRSTILVLTAFLGLHTTGLPAEDPAPAPTVTLDRVRQEMAAAETIYTHFVQERHLTLFTEPLRSEGVLCCQKPARIRWEITDPYRSILVSDGSGVAQFEWLDGRWKKLDLGLADALQAVVNQIAGVIQGSYAGSQREFDTSINPHPSGPVLTLTPKIDRIKKVLSTIEVHLTSDLKSTRQVILREATSDHTVIRFDQQRANVSYPDRTFDRKQPLDLEQVRLAVTKSGP
jgi:outer membrane lipoprotein-sorting protein